MNIFHLLNNGSLPTVTVLLLKVTSVLIVAWLLQTALRRSNPRWRILLWRISAVGIVSVALFSLRDPMFTLPLLPPPTPVTVAATTQQTDTARNRTASPLPANGNREKLKLKHQANHRHANHQGSTTFSDSTIDSLRNNSSPPLTGGSELKKPIVFSESTQNSTPISQNLSTWEFTTWIWRLWLAGVLLGFVHLLAGLAHLAKVCRSSIAVPEWIESELAQQIAATPEVGKVTARQSVCITAPCSVGLMNKTILLPSGMCGTGQTDEIRAIFAHELAHFSGKDLRWNYVFYCLSILLWFHPFVWRIRLAHADACDERCDAQAVSRLGDGAGYIKQLAHIALQVSGQTPTSALPMARVSSIAKRIQMLQQGIGQLNLRRWKAGLVAMTAALLLMFIGAMELSRSVAQTTENKQPVADQSVGTPEAAEERQEVAPAGFSGRLIDETGAPVTDATIKLSGERRNDDPSLNHFEAKSDKAGRFVISDIKQADTYRISISSRGWVGFTNRNQLPKVQLSPKSAMVRDFTLPRACSIRIRTVDEAGKPVRNVSISAASLANDRSYLAQRFNGCSTNKQGWATIRGLKPSNTEYLFGTSSKDYGCAKLAKVLDDPTAQVEEVLVLSRGKDVSGTVTCSDGKPAAGWRISATPTWGHLFSVSPIGSKIAKDGSFTLPHITEGKYDITVSIPIGNSLSRAERVQSDVNLASLRSPLDVQLRTPSPQSMVAITGKIATSGPKFEEHISIQARSENGEHLGSTVIMPGDTSFRISPLPPGRYHLTFNSTEVEQKPIANVKAPSDGLKLELKVTGRPRLVGKVVRADTEKALSRFKIRVLKVRTLRGPNYVQDPQWQTIENDNGEFAVDVVGPGIYQIVASSEKFAESRSAKINTDEYQGEPITLQMDSGVTLTGTVVDENGDPIDGAMVIPLSRSVRTTLGNGNQTWRGDGSVIATQGKFTLHNLSAGKEVLKFTHPKHCFVLSSEVEIGTDDIDLKPIVMTRGGTVQGHVYDDSGQPEQNATLYFQDRSGYDERFATAVTDKQGYYEAQHLPEKLCYVHQADPWTKQGTVRSAVLPVNGETQRLDFGGKRTVTGRLLVNGKPLDDTRVQLSGSNPNFGIYKAFARTNTDGKFTFWGPSHGRRILYYAAPGRRNDWIRAGEVSIESTRKDLGDINVRSTDLTVSLTGLPEDQANQTRMTLKEYDPIWTFGIDVGVRKPKENATDPFVFGRVPTGKYELVCYRQDSLAFRKLVTVDASKAEQTATIAWPEKTGTLEVSMEDPICGPGGCNPPNLWSDDQHINATLHSPTGNNKVRFENLPAGRYYLADGDTRDSPRVLEFSVEPDETKRLDLTSESYTPQPMDIGVFLLRCFTKQGVPLTGCEVAFDNGGTDLRKQVDQDGRQMFIGTPGIYTMSVTFPGYQTIQRKVTVQQFEPDGRSTGDFEVNIRMTEVR